MFGLLSDKEITDTPELLSVKGIMDISVLLLRKAVFGDTELASARETTDTKELFAGKQTELPSGKETTGIANLLFDIACLLSDAVFVLSCKEMCDAHLREICDVASLLSLNETVDAALLQSFTETVDVTFLLAFIENFDTPYLLLDIKSLYTDDLVAATGVTVDTVDFVRVNDILETAGLMFLSPLLPEFDNETLLEAFLPTTSTLKFPHCPPEPLFMAACKA